MPVSLFRRDALPYEARFLAGRAFLAYRRRGGTRPTPLPDFYIGAHAAVAGLRLLTRDARSFRTYLPTLRILSPKA
jgi:predicted nucleic acid-binding protein